MQGVSIREFGRRDGCSEKLVRRAIAGGFLQTFQDGSLDPALVGTGWRKSNRADKGADAPADTVRIELEPQPHGGALKRSHAPPPPDVGDEMSLAEAERVKAQYLALQRRLEYERAAALVVPVADVATLIGAEYARVRTRLLAIPSEHAPRISRLKTVAEVQDVLMGLITLALEELASDGPASDDGA